MITFKKAISGLLLSCMMVPLYFKSSLNHISFLKLLSFGKKKPLLVSSIIILLSSTVFGLWFKITQISIASPEVVKLYPFTGYFVSTLESILIISVLWLGLAVIYRTVDRGKSTLGDNLLSSAWPFTAFMFSLFNMGLSNQVRLFLLFVLIQLFQKIYKNRPFLRDIKEPLFAFLLIVVTLLLSFRTFSPLYHTSFADMWGRLDYFINFEHQWENAKAFTFLDNFTQQAKLGGYQHAVWLISELSALIVLLFDIPLVDILGKWDSIKFMYFGLYVFSTYGCYLFFRYGLRFSFWVSFIGGLGYLLGNRYFLYNYLDEFSTHQTHFLFFPWALLFIKVAHSRSKLLFACLAGLIISLADYSVSSHPEIELLCILFLNAYNIYLGLVRLAGDRFGLKAIKDFIKYAAIFPLFNLLGLSFRLVPLFDALFSKEYFLNDARFDPPAMGMFWGGNESFFSNLFFRFDPPNVSMMEQWGQGNFYTGPFITLMIFSFVCCLFYRSYQRLTRAEPSSDNQLPSEDFWFFLIVFLFMAFNLPLGQKAFFSKVLAATGFLRIHALPRIGVFYYFFSLATAMYGLHYLLGLKKLLHLNVIFFAYIFFLACIYFNPFLLRPPLEGLLLDAAILTGLYLVLFLAVKWHNGTLFPGSNKFSLDSIRHLPNRAKFLQGSRLLIMPTLSVLALYSFITVDNLTKPMVTQPKLYPLKEPFKKGDVFTSFRTAVTLFKNNQHDEASLAFLDKRVEQFATDLTIKRQKRGVSDEEYHRISKVLGKYMHLDPDLERPQKILPPPPDIKKGQRKPLSLTKSENLKTLEAINVSSALWKPKKTAYLIKRKLGVFPDSVWRYVPHPSQNRNSTVVQRRFNMNLHNIETVDLVFGPEISRKDLDYSSLTALQNNIKEHGRLLTELNSQLVEVPVSDKKQFRSLKKKIKNITARLKKLVEKNNSMNLVDINFRLAGTALSDSEYIIPAHYLPAEIIAGTQKEKTFRIHIGHMIRDENYLLLKKNSGAYFKLIPGGSIYLKEMIVFLPGQLKNVFETRPLKRINFMGLKKAPSPADKPDTFKPLGAPDIIMPARTFKKMFRDWRSTWLKKFEFLGLKKIQVFWDWMGSFKPSWKSNLQRPIEFYNEIAPEVDNFYLFDGPTMTIIGASPIEWGALSYDVFNAVQFYLPDRYQLVVYSSDGVLNRGMLPVGKNSALDGGLYTGVQGSYPTIHINFHLESLYEEEYWSGDQIQDYMFTQGLKLERIASNDTGVKKLLDIYGADYVVFHKYYSDRLPPDTLGALESIGFVPVKLPNSFRFTPRFSEAYKMYVYKNPQSYGKAYIARWVRTHKPSFNLANSEAFSYFKKWPWTKALEDNFTNRISEISDNNIWRSILIESSDPDDHSDNPFIYNADNEVDVKKIIGSKAVFDVDCKEEHCWFVYNSAFLKGWRAFSGAEELSIHKANLGFIGVKLDKGKHLLWMDYRPVSRDIGLILALVGWLFVLGGILHKWNQRKRGSTG